MTMKKSSKKANISEIFFTDTFDYSNVTQDNVKILGSILEGINPALVIIPFFQAFNRKRKILGQSSLLASREIKNIIMFELTRNVKFIPQIFFPIEEELNLKMSYLRHPSDRTKEKDLQRRIALLRELYTKEFGINIPVEVFQSHKLSLIDDDNNIDAF
jgi:hypothetical protein